ncbi:hypothetical protein BMF94_2458 [Rhodotorula taiwanensis]|uniref:Uncharacterized protein n=1 Tax=Rhodotorula taiwanensis TaxID=741276 RepID=A0A2S5BCG0_9BASI|nr:hypothetical protein BMF94_2458 [Rhodotorula taiwanensis]
MATASSSVMSKATSSDYTRVQAGYKAAAHNKSLQEETRKNAEQMLRDLEAQHDKVAGGEGAAGDGEYKPSGAGASNVSTADQSTTESHEETVHEHRVIGGLKANLHRSDRSDETKESVKAKLHNLGVDEI